MSRLHMIANEDALDEATDAAYAEMLEAEPWCDEARRQRVLDAARKVAEVYCGKDTTATYALVQAALKAAGALAKKDREKLATLSMHIGDVGERVATFGCLYLRCIDNGGGKIHVFRDREDDELLFWTDKDYALEQGETYTVIGTVKDHLVHNRYCQTELEDPVVKPEAP